MAYSINRKTEKKTVKKEVMVSKILKKESKYGIFSGLLGLREMLIVVSSLPSVLPPPQAQKQRHQSHPLLLQMHCVTGCVTTADL